MISTSQRAAILDAAQHIETENDVRRFFGALIQADIAFHPEETLADIVDPDGVTLFSAPEVAILDAAMGACFAVCPDPCGLVLDLVNGPDAELRASVLDLDDPDGLVQVYPTRP